MTKKLVHCRICKGKRLFTFLNLGTIPLPNGFLKLEDLKKKENKYPLNTAYCMDCGLVQLAETVNPEAMFKNYVYIPSSSKTRMSNFADIAFTIRNRFHISTESLVIDIGSNDGSLLSYFRGYGIKTLGIDPATNLAKIAQLKGIETINDYISQKLAKKIRSAKGTAKIITATNVVAHIQDLHDLFNSIKILLSDNGAFICEFPYLMDLIEKNQFDTIYHEHLSYFSVKPLLNLLSQVNLHLIDIERTSIDGGSLRVYIGKKENQNNNTINDKIKDMIAAEEKFGLGNLTVLKLFAKRIKRLRRELKMTLQKLKNNGKTIAAYGAAAKGNILLNYCSINNTLIDFAVDSTPYKQGLYTPGSHIRIYPEVEISKRKPDYILLLAWNFAKEIMDKEKNYITQGGKFIIPVPSVSIVP